MATAQLSSMSRGARDLSFGQSLSLLPYFCVQDMKAIVKLHLCTGSFELSLMQ